MNRTHHPPKQPPEVEVDPEDIGQERELEWPGGKLVIRKTDIPGKMLLQIEGFLPKEVALFIVEYLRQRGY